MPPLLWRLQFDIVDCHDPGISNNHSHALIAIMYRVQKDCLLVPIVCKYGLGTWHLGLRPVLSSPRHDLCTLDFTITP